MSRTNQEISGYDETAPVLIVGGSLVGLSTALFLASHGVRPLLVERHAGISPHPRAFNFNMRTMEIFRAAGVEEAIRQAEPTDYRNSSVLQAESLAGKELGWITQDATESDLSAVLGSITGQDMVEPVLRKHAEELGCDLRFSTELISFEQDATGVNAVIRERASGRESRVRARYLVAADGNRSMIRRQLGIGVQGPGVQGHQMTLLFSADLSAAFRGRRIAICFVNNAALRGGTLILARGEGRGYGLYAPYRPEQGEQDTDFVGPRGVELVRAAIGLPNLPVEILNVTPWEVAAWVAERFQQENVFLVGDAAHVTPPTGAFGANTGIADAYNLAWKLALVLQNNANPELLLTYDEERRPVARFTIEQAFAMYARFASPHLSRNAPPVDYDAVAFGYRYHSTCLPSESGDDGVSENPHEPSGRPGTHAAHVSLRSQDQQISTLDLFGQGFVLLTGARGVAWSQAAREVSQRLGQSISVHQIGDGCEFADPAHHFLHAYGLSEWGAVLVRPDGFISWRSVGSQERPAEVLEQALRLSLAQPVPEAVSMKK
ncbi:MAG TPA: FAD-dependent monooxygenase [Ktedonobacteraceae bacterium]|nr:FAD-dependent monooxygenase [Ktedonobacteraceae bacterium]